MNDRKSAAGGPSRAFQGDEGTTIPEAQFSKADHLVDSERYDSEGNWAFCVFEGDDFLVARFGFQMGGFNITDVDAEPDKSVLQLHLELVSDEGAIIWVPSGQYTVDQLSIARDDLRIQLSSSDEMIFSIEGWPKSRWHFRSDNGELEIDLEFVVSDLTILPDCVLPYCVFAMWETVTDVSGTVRYKERSANVRGKVFHDHPRIINTRSKVEIRNSYLYTAISFEDGSAWYSYHAHDRQGAEIPYYCFGDFIDSNGVHAFSKDTELTEIELDENHLPKSWRISREGANRRITIDVSRRPFSLLESRGAGAPTSSDQFWIYPFVLDCTARIESDGKERIIHGRGLPEYFNLDHRISSGTP